MHPIEQLVSIADDFRHIQYEHQHEGIESRWRRRQGARMEDLEHRFESLLTRWVRDPEARERWRRYLHHGGERPSTNIEPPPLFKGTAGTGSVVELRPRHDGNADVIVDGSPTDHLPIGAPIGATLRADGNVYEERFDAPETALVAMLDHFSDPSGEPPWEHAPELFADGLIDQNFGLTARGQRLLDARLRAA